MTDRPPYLGTLLYDVFSKLSTEMQASCLELAERGEISIEPKPQS